MHVGRGREASTRMRALARGASHPTRLTLKLGHAQRLAHHHIQAHGVGGDTPSAHGQRKREAQRLLEPALGPAHQRVAWQLVHCERASEGG